MAGLGFGGLGLGLCGLVGNKGIGWVNIRKMETTAL